MATKTTLRAQWDSRAGYWRIVMKTDNGAGGWALFHPGTYDYFRKESCEDRIKILIRSNPDQYQEG